jgi:4-aminobutyrate aminotransferase-like enzyme
VPPLVIADDEARQGIAVIDQALEVADRYCAH